MADNLLTVFRLNNLFDSFGMYWSQMISAIISEENGTNDEFRKVHSKMHEIRIFKECNRTIKSNKKLNESMDMCKYLQIIWIDLVKEISEK